MGAASGPMWINPQRLVQTGRHLHHLQVDEMGNFDLAPLYRAAIGFDRIADVMDRAERRCRSPQLSAL
jgi:hypothetical protein